MTGVAWLWRAMAVLMAVLLALLPARAPAADDFSEAERALFMRPQLKGLKPPQELRYHFARRGTLASGIDDQLTLRFTARPDGRCCQAQGEFAGEARQGATPPVEQAESNPALLYFLERDIAEMQRLTSGRANYFRKRIRMAVYQGARVTPLKVPWRGQMVAAQQIEIDPYLDDPLRARYERLATKRYQFVLSDAVPGGIYAIRTQVNAGEPGAARSLPLWAEALWLDGAAPPLAALPLTAPTSAAAPAAAVSGAASAVPARSTGSSP